MCMQAFRGVRISMKLLDESGVGRLLSELKKKTPHQDVREACAHALRALKEQVRRCVAVGSK